jgi:hypothetical protein
VRAKIEVSGGEVHCGEAACITRGVVRRLLTMQAARRAARPNEGHRPIPHSLQRLDLNQRPLGYEADNALLTR